MTTAESPKTIQLLFSIENILRTDVGTNVVWTGIQHREEVTIPNWQDSVQYSNSKTNCQRKRRTIRPDFKIESRTSGVDRIEKMAARNWNFHHHENTNSWSSSSPCFASPDEDTNLVKMTNGTETNGASEKKVWNVDYLPYADLQTTTDGVGTENNLNLQHGDFCTYVELERPLEQEMAFNGIHYLGYEKNKSSFSDSDIAGLANFHHHPDGPEEKETKEVTADINDNENTYLYYYNSNCGIAELLETRDQTGMGIIQVIRPLAFSPEHNNSSLDLPVFVGIDITGGLKLKTTVAAVDNSNQMVNHTLFCTDESSQLEMGGESGDIENFQEQEENSKSNSYQVQFPTSVGMEIEIDQSQKSSSRSSSSSCLVNIGAQNISYSQIEIDHSYQVQVLHDEQQMPHGEAIVVLEETGQDQKSGSENEEADEHQVSSGKEEDEEIDQENEENRNTCHAIAGDGEPKSSSSNVDTGTTDTDGEYGDLCKRPLKSKRPRMTRTRFTRDQVDELKRRFNFRQHIFGEARDMVARELNITPNQVGTWFQNRRNYVRKKALLLSRSCGVKKPNPGNPESPDPDSTTQ